NQGIPRVLNQILRAAVGDAIVILHDHDWFSDRLLESLVDLAAEYPEVGLVNPGVAWADADRGRYEQMAGLPTPISDGQGLVERLLLGSDFSCPITACALVPRRAYEAVGFYYDEEFGFLDRKSVV